MAIALGPKDDVVWSWHAAHPANCLHSLQGKGLSQDLKQVNVLHDYVGHPSIVMGEVVDLWHTHIALGEVGQVVQHHNLGVEGQVCAKLDGVLAKWEAASVVAVIPILVLMLGMGAHDSCNDWLPQRWESPQGPAALGSAIGLAPQSPGLLGGLKGGTGVS